MIAITGTTESLELKLATAAATTELPINAAFVDVTLSTMALSGGSSPTFHGITTGSTPVVLSAAVGALLERQLNSLTLVNVDTAPVTATVQVDVSGTKRIAVKVILSVGDVLIVTLTDVRVLDSAGNLKQVVGLSAYGDPITVAHGGTAATTLTNHGVLLGQGTSAVAATAVGATNTLLHGNTGADPTYSAVVEGDLSTSDVTTANVTSTKHGFAPKSPADATNFLNGAATPAFAAVKDSDLSTSDITTNNVSTSKHGFAPKAPADATKYLDGTGAYSVPAGSSGGDVVRLYGAKGTSTTTTATIMDSYALSGLTDLDTLEIEVTLTPSAVSASFPGIRNTTDSLTIYEDADNVTAGVANTFRYSLRCSSMTVTKVGCFAENNINGNLAAAASVVTFTTNFTGSWTLGIRYNAMASGTMYWSWAIFRKKGQ